MPNPQTKPRPFLFLDGEGGNNPDGSHDYVLLCAWSEHTGNLVLQNPDRSPLRSWQILDWLLGLHDRLKQDGNPHTFIGFGLGYDVAMWLKDLPERPAERFYRPDKARHLDEKGQARWVSIGPYLLKQLGQQTTVMETTYGPWARATKETRQYAAIWDVWKFFQGSFVKALTDWGIISQADLDRMDAMKRKRSTFQASDFQRRKLNKQLIRYCLSECRAGVRLMEKLAQTCRELGFDLAGQYHGAGSLAAAMLRTWCIKEYMSPVPKDMAEAVACAYAGGRFQNGVHGMFQDRVWQADINSAYPTIIKDLPCLAHVSWEPSTELDYYGLYEIEWELPRPCRWGSLPHRDEKGTITYPRKGIGWHWGSEILAGERLYPGSHTVRRGWRLRRNCDHVPFAKVPETYKARLALGAKAAGIVLKLGLNSLYGKTAQSVGMPSFANYIWAGMITAGCRAMILDGIRLTGPAHVLAIATDAILTDTPPPVPTTPGEKHLGEWEIKEVPGGVLFIEPGIMISYDAEGRGSYKSRGLGRREFAKHTELAAQAWKDNGVRGNFAVKTHRFIGFKSALARGKYEERCRWIDMEMRLSYFPQRRMPLGIRTIFAHLHDEPARTVEMEGTGEPSAPYKQIHKRLTNDGFDAAVIIGEQPAMECRWLEWEFAQ
jgi:hypothetical protein